MRAVGGRAVLPPQAGWPYRGCGPTPVPPSWVRPTPWPEPEGATRPRPPPGCGPPDEESATGAPRRAHHPVCVGLVRRAGDDALTRVIEPVERLAHGARGLRGIDPVPRAVAPPDPGP